MNNDKAIAKAIYLSSAFFLTILIYYFYSTGSSAFGWIEWAMPIILIYLFLKK